MPLAVWRSASVYLSTLFDCIFRNKRLGINSLVPHPSPSRHMFTCVRGNCTQRIAPSRFLSPEPVMASGDDNTDRQSFDIPFPGTWKGLVEIVDVKYNVSFWSGEPSKIQEVAVTTGARMPDVGVL